jgi:Ca2+-binding EF-hand superfamily protein
MLTEEELSELMNRLGIPVSDRFLRDILALVDKNHKGWVRYKDFEDVVVYN